VCAPSVPLLDGAIVGPLRGPERTGFLVPVMCGVKVEWPTKEGKSDPTADGCSVVVMVGSFVESSRLGPLVGDFRGWMLAVGTCARIGDGPFAMSVGPFVPSSGLRDG
jgi:hypothetical protein